MKAYVNPDVMPGDSELLIGIKHFTQGAKSTLFTCKWMGGLISLLMLTVQMQVGLVVACLTDKKVCYVTAPCS